MNRYVVLYLATLVVLIPIDFLFLGIVAKGFFAAQVGDMLGDVRPGPAVLFYLVYVAGVLIFVSGEAASGTEALAHINKCLPAVVVLDQMMPRRTGLETAKLIRQQHPGLPIVLFSAYLSEEIERTAREQGINSCLSKTHAQRLPQVVRDVDSGDAFYGGDDLVDRCGLVDEGIGAGCDRLLPDRRSAEAREHHDARPRRDGAHVKDGLQSVHHRHEEVHDDDVGPEAVHEALGAFALTASRARRSTAPGDRDRGR